MQFVATFSDGFLHYVSILATKNFNPSLSLATENFQFVTKLLSLATENSQFVATFSDGFLHYVAILATENLNTVAKCSDGLKILVAKFSEERFTY